MFVREVTCSPGYKNNVVSFFQTESLRSSYSTVPNSIQNVIFNEFVLSGDFCARKTRVDSTCIVYSKIRQRCERTIFIQITFPHLFFIIFMSISECNFYFIYSYNAKSTEW